MVCTIYLRKCTYVAANLAASLIVFITVMASSVYAAAAQSNSTGNKDYINGLLNGAIQYNPYLRNAVIGADIDDRYIVTLNGSVNDAVTKALAEQIALSIKGVRGVRNNLAINAKNNGVDRKIENQFGRQAEEPQEGENVTPLPYKVDNRLSNVTITNKVRSQLLANTGTRGIDIEIETDSRVVTLTGRVANLREKELAYWVVKNTRGVAKVIDQLDLQQESEMHAAIARKNELSAESIGH